MLWTRKPRPDTAAALGDASVMMMEAIASGKGRGMAWIDFLAADAAHEAAAKDDNEALRASAEPERRKP